ncbi:MAG: DNA repair protein RecN [Acidimicrobiia bacterium]|nr:MAG: DNA repair protein RecN [Acidimicrobiia bacterium]
MVDLHGQHAHQSLLTGPEQRALLDRSCGAPAAEALARLRAARAELRRVDAALAALGGDERARAREIDLTRFQVEEIARAGITGPDEDERLAAEEELLADAEAHREALRVAHDVLADRAADALGAAVAALAGREPFAALASRVRALQAEVVEAANDARLALDGIVADPERLAEVQARRALLRELTRKYGATLAEVIDFGERARRRLEELESHTERAGALAAERDRAHAEAARAAAELTRVRTAGAGPLADAVSAHLHSLAMPHARFEVRVEPAEQTDEGADQVVFLLAANPGEPARPLARTASGGELSRAMLALRLVLSEAPPTLVFDEVDAGIGGEAGLALGRALARLGAAHQVLCVTHLPQVAAFADAHVAVEKTTHRGRTRARAALLLDDARVTEIARMLGGDVTSDRARDHARELLAKAARARAGERAR